MDNNCYFKVMYKWQKNKTENWKSSKLFQRRKQPLHFTPRSKILASFIFLQNCNGRLLKEFCYSHGSTIGRQSGFQPSIEGLISFLPMQMVEILSKWHCFLRGNFYTEKGHGIILYLAVKMPHAHFFFF